TAGFSTRAIHVGSEPSGETGACMPRNSNFTTYKQDAIGVHKGFEYTRSDNPNRRSFEAQLASIEAGGHTAIAVASGSSATALLVTAAGPNSHILSVNDVYGGTARYFTRVANVIQNLATTFIDLESARDDEVYDAIQDNTKLIWVESPTNPTLRIIDIPRIVRIANSHPSRPLVIVDNTFLSPFYSSPFLLGADVVLHSVTKYVNGHSDVLMGAVVLPLPHTSTKYPNPKPLAATLESKLRFLQNAIGAVPSAYDSWLAQRGVKTLALRMKAHGENALAVARWLSTRGKELGLVDWVIYPGLKSTASRRVEDNERVYKLVRDTLLSPHARKWIEGGTWSGRDDGLEGIPFSGMVSFKIASAPSSILSPAEVSEPTSTASRFLTSTRLFSLAESLGGVESLAELPALMTHAGIPVETREKLGISSGLIRLSIGVEDKEDLLVDLERALRWAVKGEVWDVKRDVELGLGVAEGVTKVLAVDSEDSSRIEVHDIVPVQVHA
ncbi:Cys/Met metabolism PLP-dependent enzyme-domain-containing protein, partial [Cantharellus anzutake]|uniref:Cys/Met metabolism PLP-dependent enzyme-domain-containing protein n=1 Tax=Cantharellus anzutake TaxID=1750568 RepID=UPI001906FFBA